MTGPLAVLLGPLVDDSGRPYRRVPCSAHPDMWDEDAAPADRHFAARICRTRCPAIVACARRALDLDGTASGVWAGVDLGTPVDDFVETDDELASWAAAARVTIRSSLSDTTTEVACPLPAEQAKPTTDSSTASKSAMRSRDGPPASPRTRRGSQSGG